LRCAPCSISAREFITSENISSCDLFFRSSILIPSAAKDSAAFSLPFIASSMTSDSFLTPTSSLPISAPLCPAAYFQRCNSSRLIPVLSLSLSISSAYSAVLFVTASNPPTAAVAPPTIAVPHFAAVLMPLPSFEPRLSAFSSVLDMLFSASLESTNMEPNKRNISMFSPAFVCRHDRQHFFFYFLE